MIWPTIQYITLIENFLCLIHNCKRHSQNSDKALQCSCIFDFNHTKIITYKMSSLGPWVTISSFTTIPWHQTSEIGIARLARVSRLLRLLWLRIVILLQLAYFWVKWQDNLQFMPGAQLQKPITKVSRLLQGLVMLFLHRFYQSWNFMILSCIRFHSRVLAAVLQQSYNF